MKTSDSYIDEIIDFKGVWDMHSRCGLKIFQNNDKHIVIVTELYQDNPGSSITSVSASLATQIIERFKIAASDLIYIESNPEMNSKLSFYDEEYYLVNFDIQGNTLSNPKWSKMTKHEFVQLLGEE